MPKWIAALGGFALAASPAAAFAQAPDATAPAAPALAPPPAAADRPELPDWLAVFKFNTRTAASQAADSDRHCPFGGSPAHNGAYSQAYAAATSAQPTLAAGTGLVGSGVSDPVGATFARIWNGNYNYVVWNDQFYKHPGIAGCSESCGAPWGHSKGILAWTDAGDGLLLQVTTPSWPAAGGKAQPRPGDGNTLGCIDHPNNLKFSQHFFALRLSAEDVGHVLDALANASVVTDLASPVLVHKGGPAELQAKLERLGRRSASTEVIDVMLSTGVRLISKPSRLNVPPWQLVSAELGGVPLRAATWWAAPKIPSTDSASPIACWAPGLPKPGAVEIATSGHWQGQSIDLKGGSGNHGKIGVSLSGDHPYAIFGDMNQQGALSGKCSSSQNGRGGLFFVVENQALHDSVAALIEGDSAALAK